ncbi:Swt1 family HEPN domain-containing protein [Bradyrhizobium sp. HKCCYLRH3097]|uniref:Swt1 family HEPN domain-containing protein n=1 Tax=Bradyrhizobium sp. HKCCYLRH3097 TaxID=3420752 RepID=UPI003EB6C682
MSDHTVELFVLKCAVIETNLRATLAEYNTGRSGGLVKADDEQLDPFIKQFDLTTRKNAAEMSRYYEIFYLLENDIRRLIVETMESAHGSSWWDKRVPQGVLDEVKKNRTREAQAAVSIRSEDDIDYTTFGQLGDIIRENWSDFAGMLSNQSAVSRVLSALNMLRGTIAHCGVLAEDEVDRLKLAIRDWFRVLEGPKG